MGEFAELVKDEKIYGPHTRKFMRGDWEAIARREDTDPEDKRLARAGIFFDDLLTFLRSEKRLSNLPFQPSALARLAVGWATWNYCRISAQGLAQFPTPRPGETAILMWPSLQEPQVPTLTGQLFNPDELITGAGDELKHMLADLQTSPPSQAFRTEYDATRKDIDNLSLEFNKALMYSSAVGYWLDCVGHGYGLIHRPDGIAHVPFDSDQEIALMVSIYRRSLLYRQYRFHIYDQWRYELHNRIKRKLCEIPLVSQVCLNFDRIESIELSQNSRVLYWAMLALAEKIIVQRGYYKNLLDESLPKLHNFTLNEMINGWRVLQSLALVVFDEIRSPVFNNAKELPRFASAKELPRFAPKIAARVLCAVFSKALHMEKSRAQQLVEAFVFRDDSSQEVWTQPLVRWEDDYWLVIPCIHSVHLERIVERWMRQGGLELQHRGPEFEYFCREFLQILVPRSPIKEAITIVNQCVQFSPPGERGEEIDLVIIVANTVLLVEAKCYLWPDDSLEFARYRKKIDGKDGAVQQIKRKRETVTRHYRAFADRLAQLGYQLPASPKITCCVLTNSAVFAGFPVEGVPIVDLDILGDFFENDWARIEGRRQGKMFERHSIQFYKDRMEAGHVLEDYLLDPPQLKDMKQSVIRLELVFPVKSRFGDFVHTSFRVELDMQMILAQSRNVT
jgi:hypothetical protein